MTSYNKKWRTCSMCIEICAANFILMRHVDERPLKNFTNVQFHIQREFEKWRKGFALMALAERLRIAYKNKCHQHLIFMKAIRCWPSGYFIRLRFTSADRHNDDRFCCKESSSRNDKFLSYFT